MLLKDSDVFQKEDIVLLKLLYTREDHMATASQLAKILNIPHHAPLNSQVGRLGKRIVAKLRIDAPKKKVGEGYNWFNVPFWGIETGEGYYWILRPELKSAMESLYGSYCEIVEGNYVSPEEIRADIANQLHEGARVQVYVNRFERNSLARQKCIEYYGAECFVCGFDFEKAYGEIGEGFIHVHHIVPISEIGVKYEVDYVNHLRPVCPNCHAILHRKNPPFSIDEIKQMFKGRE
jgi:5-methylcytosine-specific restriction protein A